MLTQLTDRCVLSITGADAQTFLQGLVTNDVLKLADGQAVYAALLSAQGKYLHDFFVVAFEQSLLIDHIAASQNALIERLTRYKLRAKVAIAPTDFQVWAAWGDAQAPHPSYADTRHPQLGTRTIISHPGTLSATASLRDYHHHRITLGIPEGHYDMIEDRSLPLEYGFSEFNGVDFSKGCYVGQEVTARMKHRANIRKCIVHVQGEDGLPTLGTPIFADQIQVGEMRSSSGTIGLALIHTSHWKTAMEHNIPLTTDGKAITIALPTWMKRANFV